MPCLVGFQPPSILHSHTVCSQPVQNPSNRTLLPRLLHFQLIMRLVRGTAVSVPVRTLAWIMPTTWLLPWLSVRITGTIALDEAMSELSVKRVLRRCRM